MTGRRARATGGGARGRRASEDLDLFPVDVPEAYDRRGASPSRAVPAPVAAEPGATAESAVAVSTLTHIAREVLEGAFVPLWVRGEVSDFKAHRNGHWYFCLRDELSQIRCVVWASQQRRIPAPPDDGMQVSAFGQLTVYAARGDMQLQLSRLEAVGDGLWRKALEQAMARLERDGLLAPERKRPLPRFPRRVAVVTSPDGAALRDIIAVVRRRCPIVELVVVPAKVQGDGAEEELVAAIDRVSRWGDADAVIVGRGGGGREDLWAFNDERVARALAACAVPTISAVGHEVDVTLCDLVADLRAPTPSAAAEAAVPVLADVRAQLDGLAAVMRGAVQRRVVDARQWLEHSVRDLRLVASRGVERRRARLENAAGRMHALSPLSTLGRGYAVARDAEGRTLASVSKFTPGLEFALTLHDGTTSAVVPRSPQIPDPRPPAP
ncbi:MAG TPA: exodeoxyribonuclease VII large subunit [Gemmatimonadaceae bacterium]|nr:exodeoxyribonuclease VII large subunit [Gemmatimonadaceae bacterium]